MLVSPGQVKYFSLDYYSLLKEVIRETKMFSEYDPNQDDMTFGEKVLMYQALNAFKRRYGLDLTHNDIRALKSNFDLTAGLIRAKIDISIRPTLTGSIV
jgi:hypothetical protein